MPRIRYVLEYPRALHKAGGLTLIVSNDAEKAAALAAGWSLTPVNPKANPPAILLWLQHMPGGERLELRQSFDANTLRTTFDLVLVTPHADIEEHTLASREDAS